MQHLTETELESLNGDYFNVTVKYSLTNETFRNVHHFHREYGTLVNQCQNLYLRENYNLTGFSQIVYCTTNKEESDIDSLDITFLVIFFSVMTLVIVATLYDKSLNRKGDKSHYKGSLDESLCE